jgi:calcium/proton exchanger cax
MGRQTPSIVLSATVGSSIQLMLLVAPLLVFAGRFIGQPMDLAFTSFEVVAIVDGRASSTLTSSE